MYKYIYIYVPLVYNMCSGCLWIAAPPLPAPATPFRPLEKITDVLLSPTCAVTSSPSLPSYATWHLFTSTQQGEVRTFYHPLMVSPQPQAFQYAIEYAVNVN